jgi:hypothetical protein
MRSILLRVLAGAVGLGAALVALGGPWAFISNEIQEASSAKQYHGHASFWGMLGGSATVLFLALILGFIAYRLLLFSFRGHRG